jgi:predicted methyltransferase
MNGNEFVQALPRRKRGAWLVEQRTVSEEEQRRGAFHALIQGHGRFTPAGTYIGLRRNGAIVMSNAPDEIRDHCEPVWQARSRGGHVLINGLGLGWVAAEILSHENVERVTVVEIERDVISLVGPSLKKAFGQRVEIVHDDALAYPDRLVPGTRFSVVWHDIWPNICASNLPEMVKLHRRYGRRCDWQGSWARHLCKRLR